MYSIAELEKVIVGSWFIYKLDSKIDTILQDSRKLENASSTLFFAIKGERLDGHHYIQSLYDKGLRNFVVQNNETLLNYSDVNYVVVKNSLEALQKVSAFHRQQFKLPVVAITGSNGKTIVKEWCHQLLQNNFEICRSPKSYNSQIGVPLSVWGLQSKHNLALFEAGISEPGEMERLQKIIQPEIGIFTTIGGAHSENFISEAHKIKEKLKLFLKAKVLIYNADIAPLHQNIREIFGKTSNLEHTPILWSWGKHEDAFIKVLSQKDMGTYTLINLNVSSETLELNIPFTDYSSVQNVMHCVVLLLYLQFNAEQINQNLQALQRVAMRLEQKKGINNSIIINDSYNSDIDSLKIVLDFLQQQKHKSKKTLILSDILQSGMSGVDLYTAVNDLLVKNKISRFIGIGDQLLKHQFIFKKEQFTDGLAFFANTQAFLQQIHEDDFADESIVLKGARKFEFELISTALEEKAHATVLEIDLNAVVHNLKVFTAQLKPGTKIMAMVKAFSYGVSSIEIAKLLEFHQVDYLAVAYADEGVTLRRAGIQSKIMVLNPEERSFQSIIKYQLEPEMYSLDLLYAFTEVLKKQANSEPYPIHIDIDTGMKRLGFEAHQIPNLIAALQENKWVQVVSVFSHLAASDEPELDNFTQEQLHLFKELSTQLVKVLPNKPLLHIANSSGIARFKEAQMDMVRLGIGMYGFNEDLQEQLQTVARLKTRVSQIKQVAKGQSVGYGRKGKAETDITIATIAIGYADGLNRLLSNGLGEVFVEGKRAPIIGNICMDMTMIDITHIEGVHEGSVVEIFGENISANELAQKLHTIPYEILTSVSERVKRVFFVD